MVSRLLKPLTHYADFNGRATRGEFWPFVAAIYGLIALVLIAAFAFGGFTLDGFLSVYFHVSPWLSLFGLIILLPLLAVTTRRLHDLDRTGWWLIAPYVVGLAAYIVALIVNAGPMIDMLTNMRDAAQLHGAPLSPADMMTLQRPVFRLLLPWVVAPSLLAQIALYVYCARPGAPGDNRFGAAPR
ncbi:MAG: DUF805 domain-containing protein [Asticcacaulis sp.]|jgi:uncharacterized membrane protein YhaH (DUF805 family)|uniref:DUF805 domain-containing protein n=1 Tax=Asticcacaulis sp. TaxID=1872648 RepID=UPI003F7C5477